MPFNENGLLGRAAANWAQEHRKRYATAFGDLETLNSACLAYLRRLTIKNNNGRHVLAAALFSRCLEHFASVVILLERGLANPARALLRIFLEATIRLGAVASDDEFWQQFILEDDLNSRTLINVIRSSKEPHFANLQKWATDERLDEIKEATRNISKMSLEEIANWNGT